MPTHPSEVGCGLPMCPKWRTLTWGSFVPEGTKCATSVNVQLPCLQKNLRTGSISRDIVNFPNLRRHRSGMFTEVARLVPPDLFLSPSRSKSPPSHLQKSTDRLRAVHHAEGGALGPGGASNPRPPLDLKVPCQKTPTGDCLSVGFSAFRPAPDGFSGKGPNGQLPSLGPCSFLQVPGGITTDGIGTPDPNPRNLVNLCF